MIENVEIDRIIFKEVSDIELDVINTVKSKRSVKEFFIRMIKAAIIIVLICVIQAFGNVSYKYETFDFWGYRMQLLDEFGGMVLFMVAAFIVFNAVSFFWGFMNRQMVSLNENYFILLEAKVVSKYSGKKLAVEGKERKKNYVTFECDQGVCTTAIPVNNKQYKSTAVGDNIVVLKEVTVEGYKLRYLKEDDYRNVYNTRVTNS